MPLERELTRLQLENTRLNDKKTMTETVTEAIRTVTAENMVHTPGHRYKGSMTRAQAWLQASRLPSTKLDVETPISARFATTDSTVVLTNALQSLGAKDEKLIDHAAVASHLSAFFSAQNNLGFGLTHVLDTHGTRYLNDLAPDITIQRHTQTADRFNVAAVIDLKGAVAGKLGKLGNLANYGQILDYLMHLVECQPGRRVFLGMFTDLQDAYLIRYSTRSTKHPKSRLPEGQLTQFKKAPLMVVLRQLYDELAQECANPPQLPFSPRAGELVRILQSHSNAIVAVYRSGGYNRIVKAPPSTPFARAIVNEIRFLQRLQSETKPASIPFLVYADEGDQQGNLLPEFGIQPVGEPIRLDMFRTAEEVHGCLEDILVALAWVHKHGLVHRDVRTDNIIVYKDYHQEAKKGSSFAYRGLLIDFDRATEIDKESVYEGGYICCPPDLLQKVQENGDMLNAVRNCKALRPSPAIGDIGGDASSNDDSPLSMFSYRPQAAHDYLAFVLLINTLLFPFILDRYSYKRIGSPNSVEAKKLLQLWKMLRKSHAWSGMVQLAAQEVTDVAQWRRYLEMIVWM